jgi:hypothetical protein
MSENTKDPFGSFCVGVEKTTQQYLDEMLDLELGITEGLGKLSREDKLRIIKDCAIEELSSYKEVAEYTKDMRIQAAQNIKEANMSNPNYIPPERFTVDMGVDGMVHIIRDSGTVEDAYIVVSEKHNKEVDYLKEMATKEHYNRQEIVSTTAEQIPQHISKIQDMGLYSMLTDKTTINSMFNNTYTTMKILGEIDTLRKKVVELEARQVISETRLDRIGVQLGIEDDDKILALKLKAQGMNNTQIAKELGVRRETVSRWLSKKKTHSLN